MIFFFSGCGNSASVAESLADILNENTVRIDINAPDRFNIAAHKRVVWVFPVYSWGMPAQVRDFIRDTTLDNGTGTEHFMVATCGDDAGLTHRMWRKEMKRKGWNPKSAHTVIMPNTYVSLPGFDVDPESVAEAKLNEATETIRQVAHAIKCRSSVDKVTKGSFPWLKTTIIYPLFMKFLCSPKPFRASTDCIGCGICSRHCPEGNIDIVNGHPQWRQRCTMCLSCYHRCPVHAVNYGNATKGKGHYTAPSVLPSKQPTRE